MVQQFFSRLPRTRSIQYLFILSRKYYLSLKLSTACTQEQSSHKRNHAYQADSEYFTFDEKIFLPVAYVTERTFIGL